MTPTKYKIIKPISFMSKVGTEVTQEGLLQFYTRMAIDSMATEGSISLIVVKYPEEVQRIMDRISDMKTAWNCGIMSGTYGDACDTVLDVIARNCAPVK